MTDPLAAADRAAPALEFYRSVGATRFISEIAAQLETIRATVG